MSKNSSDNTIESLPILKEIDAEDRPLIKRIILGDQSALEKIEFKELDFKEAVSQGAMVISVPRELVEKLQSSYEANIERLNDQNNTSIKHKSKQENLNE